MQRGGVSLGALLCPAGGVRVNRAVGRRRRCSAPCSVHGSTRRGFTCRSMPSSLKEPSCDSRCRRDGCGGAGDGDHQHAALLADHLVVDVDTDDGVGAPSPRRSPSDGGMRSGAPGGRAVPSGTPAGSLPACRRPMRLGRSRAHGRRARAGVRAAAAGRAFDGEQAAGLPVEP